VTVTIDGAQQPTLWGAQTGFVPEVYKILGVTWDPGA
jgi:hypothetical protein